MTTMIPTSIFQPIVISAPAAATVAMMANFRVVSAAAATEVKRTREVKRPSGVPRS